MTIPIKPGAPDTTTWNSDEELSSLCSADFETFFSDQVSLRKMSPWAYCWHPETAPYLVALEGPGWKWCGDPRDFTEWGKLNGRVLSAHNASFDALVWKRAQADGIIPADCNPKRWVCSADLVAHLRIYRSLQNAVKILYGVDVSKEYRFDAKGKTGAELKASDAWPRIVGAGGVDAEWSRKIALDHLRGWPVEEQLFSQWNREASWRGFAVNVEKAEAFRELLEDSVFNYGKAIPWYPDEKALSPIAIRKQGRKDGIKVPASLAKTDPAAQKFYEAHSDTVPWVRAVRDFRQANMLLEKVKTLQKLVREDGTAPYQSVYFGAHSGRLTSGVKRRSASDETGGAYNLYNQPKTTMQGVDLRSLIVPRKGYKFILSDFAQIEARLLLYYAGDIDTLNLIREGYNLYEARATQLLGLQDTKGLKKKEPLTYAMVKALVLGAGYQMGYKKFMLAAPVLTGGLYRPTEEEAKKAIYTFRDKSPLITQLWNRHQAVLWNSASQRDPTHRVQLASGSWITYFNPKFVATTNPDTGQVRTEVEVSMLNGEPPQKIFSGRIVENIMQATGYQVLRDATPLVERLDDCSVDFTVYDELAVEVPESKTREYGEEIARIMTTSSPWLKDCPLEVEWAVHDCYTK